MSKKIIFISGQKSVGRELSNTIQQWQTNLSLEDILLFKAKHIDAKLR